MIAGAKLTIGRLAKAGGVGLATVRYYQRRGLLAEPDKPQFGGVRLYGESDLNRLLQIRRAQELGFTLAEIAEILANVDSQHCARNRSLAAKKLTAITRHIRELQKIRKTLATISEKCPEKCLGACPLMHSFNIAYDAQPQCRHSESAEGVCK